MTEPKNRTPPTRTSPANTPPARTPSTAGVSSPATGSPLPAARSALPLPVEAAAGSGQMPTEMPTEATAERAQRRETWLSVWATSQRPSRFQRLGRYLPESGQHPAKMLPAIAAHAIAAYTRPGDVVLDPMCGIGTSLVEAVHAGRDAVGVEYESRWAQVAAANLAHAARQGATGSGLVIAGDARDSVGLVPAQLHGRVALVITSPPYGPSAHGHVTARGGRKVSKVHFRYSDSARGSANLAYDPGNLLGDFTRILTACAQLLRPDGRVVITTRPWRHGGLLVDLPGAVLAAAPQAGLVPVERCVALLSGLRGQGLVGRPSFFQLLAVRRFRDAGLPLHVIAHEDVLVLAAAKTTSGTSPSAALAAGASNGADGPATEADRGPWRSAA